MCCSTEQEASTLTCRTLSVMACARHSASASVRSSAVNSNAWGLGLGLGVTPHL